MVVSESEKESEEFESGKKLLIWYMLVSMLHFEIRRKELHVNIEQYEYASQNARMVNN